MTTAITSIDANTSSVQVNEQEAMRLTTAGVVVASQNGGPIAGHRNRIINGNFVIYQRGSPSSGVAYAAGAYIFDRWKAGAAGCTLNWAASGADVVATITAGSLMQVVEDINVEGGVYALSHAGTAQARIGINGAAPAGAYATASRSSPIITASATAKQTMTVEFTTGTVSLVQIEPVDSANPKATPFERRLYGVELMLCLRYYEKSYDVGVTTIGGVLQSTAVTAYILANGSMAFRVVKRAPPTLKLYSPNSGAVGVAAEYNAGGTFVADRAVGLAGSGITGFEAQVSGIATVNNNLRLHWDASAEL